MVFSVYLNDLPYPYLKEVPFLNLRVEKSMYNYSQCRLVLSNVAQDITSLNLCYPTSRVKIEVKDGLKKYEWSFLFYTILKFSSINGEPKYDDVKVLSIVSPMQFEKKECYVKDLSSIDDFSVVSDFGVVPVNKKIRGVGYGFGGHLASVLHCLYGWYCGVYIDYSSKNIRVVDLGRQGYHELIFYSENIEVEKSDQEKAVQIIECKHMNTVEYVKEDEKLKDKEQVEMNKHPELENSNTEIRIFRIEPIVLSCVFLPQIFLGMRVGLKVSDGSGEYVRKASDRLGGSWYVGEYEHKIGKESLGTKVTLIRASKPYDVNGYVQVV